MIFACLFAGGVLPAAPKADGAPLWMRYKVLDGIAKPFHIEVECVPDMMSKARPAYAAGFLVRGEAIKNRKSFEVFSKQAKAQKKDMLDGIDQSPFLEPGVWSPWIRTFRSGALTGHVHAKFFPAQTAKSDNLTKYGLAGLTVAFQVAWKPDAAELIVEGVEKTGRSRGVFIMMPPKPDADSVRLWVKSFNQWADERLRQLRELGFDPGQGPRKILAGTDSYLYVDADAASVVEACARLGFNGLELAPNIPDLAPRSGLAEQMTAAGFTWRPVHHIANITRLGAALRARPLVPGKAGDAVAAALEKCCRERTRGYLSRLSPEDAARSRLNILADEPGAQPPVPVINAVPQIRAYFHEFLQSHGLTPEFFGKQAWDEVDALGYQTRRSAGLEDFMRAEFGIKINWLTAPDAEAAPAADDDEAATAKLLEAAEAHSPDAPGLDPLDSIQQQEELRQIDIRIVKPNRQSVEAEPVEKRLYHWTQLFRAAYTELLYQTSGRVAVEMFTAHAGQPLDCRVSPNFQAMPIMAAQMWDGAMNLFTWARSQTTNLLMMEDWINDPYRVAFGFRLLQAAARKQGQELGHLIVNDRYEKARYLTALALDARVFYSYSYGLVRRKGPAWAYDQATARNWGEVLRWTRRFEEQLLASKSRPCQAALLVANTSEINSAYFNANHLIATPGFRFHSRPLFQRAALHTALLNAGVPVEIVGEDEILADNALDRYRLLFVVDPHVAAAAQEKIRDWVAGGGVLWANFAALSRQEYDESSAILNSVFGLAAREPLPSLPEPPPKTAAPLPASFAGNDFHPAVNFAELLGRPGWTPAATAKVIATFADGSPAALAHAWGRGHAYLLAASAYALSPSYSRPEDPAAAAAAGRIAAMPFFKHGLEPQVRLSQPDIISFVRDGADFSLLFLINASGTACQNLDVEFFSGAEITAVTDAAGRTYEFSRTAAGASFRIPALPDNDGVIIELKTRK